MIFAHLHAVIVSAALALADETTTADTASTTDLPDLVDSLASIPQITFTDAIPSDLSPNVTGSELPEPTLEPTGNVTFTNTTSSAPLTTSSETSPNKTATKTEPSGKKPTATKEPSSNVPPSNGGMKLSAVSLGLPLVAAIACLL